MKLLVFADLHSNLKILEKLVKKIQKEQPDIILCAGDLSSYGKGLPLIVKKLSQLKITTFIIHGNHESEENLNQLCSDNIIFLHKRTYTIRNYTFFGYGGGGFDPKDPKLESLIPKVKKIAKEKLIFLTHMPPYNTKLDYLPRYKKRAGSLSSLKFIKETKPILVVCGHLHENFNKHDYIGKTLVINPGPLGQVLEI